MRERAVAPVAKATSIFARGHVLRRKCACGGGASALTGECTECSSKRLQKKLAVGASDDSSEVEADRVADQVMAMRAPAEVSAGPVRVRRFAQDASASSEQAPQSVDRALASPSRALEPDVREDFESRFGHDFSQVRVHTGPDSARSAREVSSLAYTVGQSIVFGAGQYAPRTVSGRRLLAHELTHTLQTRSEPGAPAARVLRRRGRERNAPLDRAEALVILADASQAGHDDSMLGMRVIEEELSRSFTLENAASRARRLRAAVSLLDEQGATLVHALLTRPKTDKQRLLAKRFGRLSRELRRDLLDVLETRTKARPAQTVASADAPAPEPPAGTAAWLPIADGVLAYLVTRNGETVKQFARTVTGHPDLPELIAQASGVAVDQKLTQGQPLLVPTEYIDFDYPAFDSMPKVVRQVVAKAADDRALRASYQRASRVRGTGPMLRHGQVGLFPVMQMALDKPARALGAIGGALFGALKRVGRFAFNLALAPYRAAKSILAFIEGTIDGLRGNLDADTLRKIIDKKPGKLELVVFVPAYTAGVLSGIVDQGKELLKGLADIITDPLGFLKSLAGLITAFFTEEGEAVFGALGQATGKEFAAKIKKLAGESLTGFAFALGEIAAFVLVEVLLTMVGAKAAKFALEAVSKLKKVKKFKGVADTLGKKFVKNYEPGAPDAPDLSKPLPRADDAPDAKAPAASNTPAAKPSKLTPADLKKLDVAARKFRITASELKLEVDDLIEQTADPKNMRRRPSSSRYDAEMHAKGHKYERSRSDDTWCRSTIKRCRGDLGETLNTNVNRALPPAGPDTPGVRRRRAADVPAARDARKRAAAVDEAPNLGDEIAETFQERADQGSVAKRRAGHADEDFSEVSDEPGMRTQEPRGGRYTEAEQAAFKGDYTKQRHALESGAEKIPRDRSKLRSRAAHDQDIADLLSGKLSLEEMIGRYPREGVFELEFPVGRGPFQIKNAKRVEGTGRGTRKIDRAWFEDPDAPPGQRKVVFQESKGYESFDFGKSDSSLRTQLEDDLAFLDHPTFEGLRVQWRISGKVSAAARKTLDALQGKYPGRFSWREDAKP